MRSPWSKLILGLLAVLAWPCLGWDGRAEAGFAPGVSTLSPKHSLDPLAEVERLSGRGGESGNDMAPPKRDDTPRPAPTTPRDLLHLAGCASGGMTSRGGWSGPGGTGSVPPLLPAYAYLVPGTDASGLLPPDDEGGELLRSGSRLFRPPRGV